MPRPRLIRPTTITIQPVDRTTTEWDQDAREPLRTVARKTTITIPGQPRFGTLRLGGRGEDVWTATGLDESANGFITVRKVDCDAIGYTPSTGDRITKVGARTTELYVIKVHDLGHWSDTDGYSLMRLYFRDRRPEAAEPVYR